MKRCLILCCFALIFLTLLLNGSRASGQRNPPSTSLAEERYGARPLCFEPNRGQAQEQVTFLSHGGDYTLFLTSHEAVFATLPRPTTTSPTQTDASQRAKRTRPTPPDTVRMRLVGANPEAAPIAADLLPGHTNYLTGSDPTRWRTHIPNYAKVAYPEVYPGIDLVYYGKQHQLEYDFVLRPHADPNAIAVRFAGAKRVHIDRQGALHLGLSQGEMVWHRPILYQQQDGNRREITGRYRLCRDSAPGSRRTPLVRFEVGEYDPALPLVIDPSIAYSTFLGGSQNDVGRAIKIDNAGNAYITGDTLSADFPTTGTLQPNYHGTDFNGTVNGWGDAFVTKLDHNGSVVFSTYIGGSGLDNANGIALSGSTICIAGRTDSPDFPLTASAYQTIPPVLGSGAATFVTALSGDGASLVYSTYLGTNHIPGNVGYNSVTEGLAVDRFGKLYITGYSDGNFPVTPGAYMPDGNRKAFVAKLDITQSGAASLVYSTYLGGSSENYVDYGWKIAADDAGCAYVVGSTASLDFPTTPGAYKTQNLRFPTTNAFVTKMNATGTALVYSTFLPGAEIHDIAVDSDGYAYVTGSAELTLATTPGAFQTTTTTYSAFVAKFDAPGSTLIFCTFLGQHSAGNAIAVEPRMGLLYVAGEVNAANFPTTPGAISSTFGGQSYEARGDAFLTKIKPDGSALLYSTYLGSAGDDVANGLAIDLEGGAYLTGFTGTHTAPPDFPTTNQTPFGGGTYDAFVTKISTARLTGLIVNPGSGFGGTIAAPSILTGEIDLDGWSSPSDFALTSSSDPTVASVDGIAGLPETAYAHFPITLHPVAVDTTVTITATFGGITATAPVTVLAPRIASIALVPSSVIGGKTANGTVTLSGPAPAGGLAVTLTSGNSLVTVPATVTVPADAITATFVANTRPVAAATQVTVTATSAIDSAGKSATLTLTPPTVTNLSIAPNSVRGSQNATGTVTISDNAPAGGILVSLSSSNSSLASGPGSVTVAAGATTATFTITTHSVAANAPVNFTATFNATSASATLTLTPPNLTSVTISPPSVKGGHTSTGTVTLSDPAPTSGILVTLRSNTTTAATVPASVSVPSGAKTAAFTVNTSPVPADTPVTLTVTFNSQTQTATLTVQAPVLKSLGLNPTNVYAFTSSTGTLTLDAPAPTGGMIVTLTSPNPAQASLPATATVPAGTTTVTFPITTGKVSSYTSLFLTATLATVTKTAELVVVPHLPFDFDYDGHNDLVLQNSQTGLMEVWFLNALTVTGGSTINLLPPTGWQIVGVGDFNGDGHTDIVIQNPTNGNVAIWYLSGTTVLGGSTTSIPPPATYKVVGVGDFNHDGHPDLLFLNQTNGQLVVWFLNGSIVIGGSTIATQPFPNYKVVGVGDFNGDGQPDIVMQNSVTNQVVVWYMNGVNFAGGGFISSTPAAPWQVKGIADYNNDGQTDIVFQNGTTNQVVIWFMNGLTVTGGGMISVQPQVPFQAVGPH